MTAMCPSNEVIAIIDATTSFQLKVGNCSSSSILANFAECCQNTTDCEFHHSLTLTQTSPDLGTINEQCNGRQRCTVQPVSVTNSRAQCNETIFEVTGTSSHYMHLNHYCIESKSDIDDYLFSYFRLSGIGQLYLCRSERIFFTTCICILYNFSFSFIRAF